MHRTGHKLVIITAKERSFIFADWAIITMSNNSIDNLINLDSSRTALAAVLHITNL